jgi:putative cofactor-binding repeat protein
MADQFNDNVPSVTNQITEDISDMAESLGFLKDCFQTLCGSTWSNTDASGLAVSGTADLITFTQSGTGAVARTSQEKMRDIVHVKDFDAKGDGVTDDTAAIQAAIDACNGKIIDFGGSDNTYLVTASLTLKSDTHLKGAGAIIDGSTIATTKHVIVGAGSLGTKTVATITDELNIAVASAAAFAEEDFSLLASDNHIPYTVTSGKTFTAATSDIITLSGPDASILVANTLVFVRTDTTLPAGLAADTKYYVRTVSGNTCKLSTTQSDVGIVDITDAGTGTHTIETGFYDYGEILQIRTIASTDVTFATPIINSYTINPVLYPVVWMNNIVIDGLDIRGSDTAADGFMGICLRFVKNFSVRNCKISGIDYYGIEINSSIHGEVRNNFIKGVYYDGATGTIFYGIILMNSCQYVNVHGNIGHKNRHLVVTTANTSGQGYYGEPLFINIDGNIFHDPEVGGNGRSYAFENHGFGRFIVWSNNISNGGYSGFNIENGSENTLIGNIIKSYAYSGIIIGGSGKGATNLCIKDNTISGMTNERAGHAAILVEAITSTFANLSISGNSIKNPYNSSADEEGIRLRANTYTNCIIDGNKIYSTVDNISYGIYCEAGSDAINIINNSIYGFRNGVGVLGDKCIVKGNIVNNSSAKVNGYGLYSSGTESVIQGNIVRYMAAFVNLAAASTSNLFINNQNIDCTDGSITDAGTTNTKRDNDTL